MKTLIARDVATARRPGRAIPVALGTAGWAQAEPIGRGPAASDTTSMQIRNSAKELER